MAYSSTEARTQILDDMAAAADALALALASLSEAYEALDDDHADALERGTFRPVQHGYGRLRRAHAEFASRHGLPGRVFETRSPGAHSADPKIYVERALDAVQDAEGRLAELQDSMLPVEVGDAELRAGLADTRALIAEVPAEGRRLLRTFGR